MSVDTALRLAAWGICVAIAMQVIFYFVFQIIGYDSFLLSMTRLVSFTVAAAILIGWRMLRKAIR